MELFIEITFEYEKRIKILEERIKELENKNAEVEFGISDLIEALKNQTIKVKINKPAQSNWQRHFVQDEESVGSNPTAGITAL